VIRTVRGVAVEPLRDPRDGRDLVGGLQFLTRAILAPSEENRMRRPWFFAACSGLVVVAVPGGAFAQMVPEPAPLPITQAFMPAPSIHQVPEHLEVGTQVFDGSLSGFRGYLDTKRATDPQLFAALDPQVRHLESRADAARSVLAAGLVGGLVFTVYAVAGQKACSQPQVTDPNFAAKVQAWGDCNSDNGTHVLTFAAIGAGSMLIGIVAAALVSPKRSDMLNLVNEHNRISHEPIRLQLGYDPSNRVAMGGLSTTF